MRPKFNKEEYKKGLEGERFINSFLYNRNFRFKWLNEGGKESKKSPDFYIYGKNDKIIAGIEVEVKGSRFKKFLKYGVHFLADKVDKLNKFKYPVYYYLIIGDNSTVYYERVENIKKKGKVIRKDTIRMDNEKFYSIDLENLKELKYESY